MLAQPHHQGSPPWIGIDACDRDALLQPIHVEPNFQVSVTPLKEREHWIVAVDYAPVGNPYDVVARQHISQISAETHDQRTQPLPSQWIEGVQRRSRLRIDPDFIRFIHVRDLGSL
jgi:hypothetical protein